MPELIIQKFIYNTKEIIDICTLKIQYYSPEQTYDLFEHEYVKRYDTHWYHKIGEKNCRESFLEIMYNKNSSTGFLHKMAEIITIHERLENYDHIICTFSGYGDCTGFTFIIDCDRFIKNKNINNSYKIVDDYDLLMEKFNSL